jgi:hypothetical protein
MEAPKGLHTAHKRLEAPEVESLGNLDFLKAAITAVVALVVSAIVLTSAYVVFSPVLASYRNSASAEHLNKRSITGRDLIVRIGGGTTNANKALELTSLTQDGSSGRALLTRKVKLSARDYPFLEYKIANRHPGAKVFLIWRTAKEPETLKNALLQLTGGDTAVFHLAANKHWRGDITEIGLDIYGDLRGEPLTVASLTPLPASATALLKTTWSEWTVFESWNQSSINHLRGAPRGALISPTAAMAAWAGLALLLLVIAGLLSKTQYRVGYVIAVVIPWVVLDLLWQERLSTQLGETRYLFAGKSQHERHLADQDGALYRYAQHLQENVLPEPGPRLFILYDNKGERHAFERLRTQFHLLPHNSYNYGSFPVTKHTDDGDYILVLKEVAGLEYDAQQGKLKWGKNQQLSVSLLDDHAIGNVYLVTGSKRR